MMAKRSPATVSIRAVKAALIEEPGLTVKDLAERLGVNRQFMAGYLAALQESKEVSCRAVGPARIYFNLAETGKDPATTAG